MLEKTVAIRRTFIDELQCPVFLSKGHTSRLNIEHTQYITGVFSENIYSVRCICRRQVQKRKAEDSFHERRNNWNPSSGAAVSQLPSATG